MQLGPNSTTADADWQRILILLHHSGDHSQRLTKTDMNTDDLPSCWQAALQSEFQSTEFQKLTEFVAVERTTADVFPAAEDVFTALKLTPLDQVRVLILGQDPYHNDGQAHGLSFSVRKGIKLPPSLRNIYKELEDDLGISPTDHGYLVRWAEQGVLMLNTVLTVRAHEPNSHKKQGWETLTTKIIQCVNALPAVAFVLWGKPAEKSAADLIDDRHLTIKTAHPSPLSARRGFFGSKPFSKVNNFLAANRQPQIDWNVD